MGTKKVAGKSKDGSRRTTSRPDPWEDCAPRDRTRSELKRGRTKPAALEDGPEVDVLGKGPKEAPGSVPTSTPVPTSAPAPFPHRVDDMEFCLQGLPRRVQMDAIRQIRAAFDAGKRFVVFEGPPGVGKSAVGVTLAKHYKRAYLCTVTKQLQGQYMRDYLAYGARELKGRSAFQCRRAGPKETCETGGTLFQGPAACGTPGAPCVCPYKDAKAEALDAWFTVANYHSYLWNVGGATNEDRQAATRPLLVLDEGHELESVLMDYVSVSVSEATLPVLVSDMPSAGPDGKPPPVDECFAWLETVLGQIRGQMTSLTAEKRTQAERLAMKILYATAHRTKERWIAEVGTDARGKRLELKPLTVQSFGGRVFQYGKRVLIMSATILDPEQMAKSVGIPMDQMAFVRSPCVFPVENRPIFVGALAMGKADRFDTSDAEGGSWPRMVRTIRDLMSYAEHPKQKGLILATSTEMMKYIRDELGKLDPAQAARLILASGDNRLKMYERHLTAREPTVLLAAGFWEGADLRDDMARFQIIPALPRGIWQGQVKERALLDKQWYNWRTLCKLVQGVGRAVRSEKDWAATYVLDFALRQELRSRNSMLPDWFREAVQYVPPESR